MSFVLSRKNPVVKWPVSIPVPMDGGIVKPHKIHLDFEIVEVTEWLETFQSLAGVVDAEVDSKTKAFLVAKTHGWHDVLDEEKEPIAFTEEGFRRLLNLPFAGQHIQAAYIECIQGRKAKN